MPVDSLFDPYESRWWVLRSLPSHERCVELLLSAKGIEYYCPRYPKQSLSRNRPQITHPPLFPGYVMARFAWDLRRYATSIIGLQRTPILQFGNAPAIITQEEIDRIRIMQANNAMPWREPAVIGDYVRIASGVFRGIEGRIVRDHGKQYFVLSVNALGNSVYVERDDLEVITRAAA